MNFTVHLLEEMEPDLISLDPRDYLNITMMDSDLEYHSGFISSWMKEAVSVYFIHSSSSSHPALNGHDT